MNGQETPLRPNIDNDTQSISLIGLPVGVPINAAPWRENVALRIAAEERRGIVRAPLPPE